LILLYHFQAFLEKVEFINFCNSARVNLLVLLFKVKFFAFEAEWEIFSIIKIFLFITIMMLMILIRKPLPTNIENFTDQKFEH
jgi:hypothetical protein